MAMIPQKPHSNIDEHFNPRFFNPKLESRFFSTPDFSTSFGREKLMVEKS
jgi:hypothetical protein